MGAREFARRARAGLGGAGDDRRRDGEHGGGGLLRHPRFCSARYVGGFGSVRE